MLPRLLVAAVLALLPATVPAAAQYPGTRVHLTGCVDGRLLFPRVDIWDEPPGPVIPGFVARLRGTSRKAVCDGEVVFVRERRLVQGKVVVRVEAVRLDVEGWIRGRFVGAPVPEYACPNLFDESDLVEMCVTGNRPPRPTGG